MKLAFGCDHAGKDIKDKITAHLKKTGYEVLEFTCKNVDMCDYPDIAKEVALQVSKGICEKGILICGTGIGMSIAANKFKNVRAAVCWEDAIAVLCKEHNNTNILCLPARFSSIEQMLKWIDIWLKTSFSSEERHLRRVEKINNLANCN